MSRFEPIDHTQPGFGTFHDELPLWSAPFGLLMLEQVPLNSEMTILDVGAGTGFLSFELAQRCGPDSTVIAVDPWDAAVQRFEERLRFLDLPNVRVIHADAEVVDLPEASIDLIVSNLGINNFENADTVLRHCLRLTRPGGRLALTTNLTGHMQEFYDVFRETLVREALHDRLEAFDAHVRGRGTVASVEAMLVGAGFDIVRHVTDSFTMRFADGSSLLRHFLIRVGFLSSWAALVADADAERVLAVLEEDLNTVARRRGSLDLTIPMAYVEAQRPA